MKNYKKIPLLFIAAIFILTGFKKQNGNRKKVEGKWNGITSAMADTMPNICSILPAGEIDSLHIFTNRLTNCYPERDPIENHQACYYEFYKPNDFPSLSIQLTKFESKEEAREEFHIRVVGHDDLWGRYPEPILQLADSAFFGYNQTDTTQCDECSLIAAQGVYVIYIIYKGQAETVPREKKKQIAMKIVRLMYDRIPGLAPSFIRNKK